MKRSTTLLTSLALAAVTIITGLVSETSGWPTFTATAEAQSYPDASPEPTASPDPFASPAPSCIPSASPIPVNPICTISFWDLFGTDGLIHDSECHFYFELCGFHNAFLCGDFYDACKGLKEYHDLICPRVDFGQCGFGIDAIFTF